MLKSIKNFNFKRKSTEIFENRFYLLMKATLTVTDVTNKTKFGEKLTEK